MNGHPDDSMVENPDQTFHPKDLGFGPLFGAVQDAVILGEVTSQRIVLWNSGAERVFGYSAEEALKMPIEVLIPKHLKERHGSGFASYAKTGQGLLVDASKLLELEAVHKSGDALFVELMLSSLNIADGRYVLAIVRDITDRKRIEIERDALLASAQDFARRMAQLTTLKADFTAMVVHELGNPLAAIRSLVDLLSREEIPTSYPHHILTAIQSEAIILQRLAEDVHITADFERDDFAVHLEPTAIATLLGEAAASFQDRLADHEFRVEPGPITRVLADPERIGQVLRNLLGNALKHTPPGTLVTLRASRANGRVRIEVADEGPGIHQDDLPRVFKKFGRGRDAQGHRRPGMGLGLYLSRRIIEVHGGELIVESEIGRGTTFSFDLEEVT